MLRKACSSYHSNSEFINWKDVKSVLLIYDSDMLEQNNEMKIAAECMEQEGKKVTECMFVDKKKAMTSSIDYRVVVDHKGIDLLGRPVGVAIEQLMNNGKFDIVIDVSDSCSMMYVSMAVEARMKCGKASDYGIFDFQIEGFMEQPKMVEEIIRYLRMINK